MIRDRDAFVFYSAMVIGVPTLFIGYEGGHETTTVVASQTAPSPKDAGRQQGVGGGPLLLAVSHPAR